MSSSIFTRLTGRDESRIAEALRQESVGGLLLLGAAIAGIVLANSPWSHGYERLGNAAFGGLSVHEWAADGLLAVFFFVVGLELKQELLVGELRDPRRAVLPVVAAVGGMVVPALVFVAVVVAHGTGGFRGWAVPTATDIAFAVAVLAVVSTNLPTALRTFLLTLAVVDDLLGVTIIAVFYTTDINLLWFAGALVVVVVGNWAMRRGWLWPMLAIAPAVWFLVHGSGVHSTIAGVLLGLSVPLPVASRIEHAVRPISAGVCVPLFAFFTAGVHLSGLGSSLGDPLAWAVIAALVVGKPLGILSSTWLFARFTRAELDPSVGWWDVAGVAMLAGIGFTVSLLIADLAFDGQQYDVARIAVIVGSVVSALLASLVLAARDRHHRMTGEVGA